MPLTPADVHNVAFSAPARGTRGYNEDEVDLFLDIVEEELTRVLEDVARFKEQMAGLRTLAETGEASAAPAGTYTHDEAEISDAETPSQRAGLDKHRVQLLLSLMKAIGVADEPVEVLSSLEGLTTADDAAVRAWLEGDGSRWIGRQSRSANLWLDL